jgi:hypothetical protein
MPPDAKRSPPGFNRDPISVLDRRFVGDEQPRAGRAGAPEKSTAPLG